MNFMSKQERKLAEEEIKMKNFTFNLFSLKSTRKFS